MAEPIIATISSIAAIASPLSKAIVDAWISPKLTDFIKDKALEKTIIEHSFESKFAEYITRSFEKQSYIRTVVFQNQQKLLNDLYLPLTVSNGVDEKSDVILIDSFRDDFIPKYHRVLLTDTAGMGKSIVSRFLFLKCISENKGIPIFIELRQLSSNRTVLDVICGELNSIDEIFDKDFILKLIRRGDFIFFLDGFDEIPFAERDEVTLNLQDFISKAGENDFILTSRPETVLASFAEFQQFRIQPLKQEEAFQLIKIYDQDGTTSKQLIRELTGGLIKTIGEFLTNPLLVSLLYKAYQFKPTIPLKKPTFYRQVYDALFENHDLTKPGVFKREKHSSLDVDDFNSVLRALGLITVRLGQVEYTKDELLPYINKAKDLCAGLKFNATDFLRDLLTTVPLFVNEGEQYKWSHKSIQEYFAALFICMDAKANQSLILKNMASSEEMQRYLNVMDLCYDIDYKTFRNTLIYQLISGFIEFHDSAYLHNYDVGITASDIELRRALCYGRKAILFPGPFLKDVFKLKKASEGNPFEKIMEWVIKNKICSANEYLRDGYVLADNGGGVVMFQPSILGLVPLLFDKGEPIFASAPITDFPTPVRLLPPFIRAVGKNPVCINDDPNESINTKELFNQASNLLVSLPIDLLRSNKIVTFAVNCGHDYL